ncbi:MAG: hypothetical protein K8T20_19160 [Planctomycetes bacterium]|nr:hypothetical protein [Planctomycetota bacterium]
MTAWHGHRDDEGIPAPVAELWKAKFRPGAPQGSNVDVAVLDSKGATVRTFGALAPSPGPGRGGSDLRGGAVAKWWRQELGEARKTLGLDEPGDARAVSLPGLPAGVDSGIRVFTRLNDRGMPAYYAPVVELVPFAKEDWTSLARPKKERTVDASKFLPWLSKMFPGGVMERTDPVTKFVYEVTGATGDLAYEPAGTKGESRFALLHGKVTLTDSGGGDFSFSGELRVVLEFRGDAAVPVSLKGVFEGTYPRKGPDGSGGFEFELTGIFESVTR